MKSINIISAFFLLIATSCNAQIKNVKTENVMIYGNCGMCEKTIETTGNLKKVAQVDWNKETKIASISYDSLKTSKEEILQRIALVGYDSDNYLAPNDTYTALHGCCQYDRAKPMGTKSTSMEKHLDDMDHSNSKESRASNEVKPNTKQKEEEVITNPFQSVYNDYFLLKDALISSDAKSASKSASLLILSIDNVKMKELKMDIHMVWMKVVNNLKSDVQTISESKDLELQRKSFESISESMYSIIKISPLNAPTYYQHCPMANEGNGANWLSKENIVMNPYYGSQMLSCGKTVETIK